jgi:hypothetical protein
VKLALAILTVLELCQYAVMARMLNYAFCAAIVMGLANLLLGAGVAANCDPILFNLLKIERTVGLVLGLAVSIVLFWLPVVAHRNVLVG